MRISGFGFGQGKEALGSYGVDRGHGYHPEFLTELGKTELRVNTLMFLRVANKCV